LNSKAIEAITVLFVACILPLSSLPIAKTERASHLELLIGTERIDQKLLDLLAANNGVVLRRLEGRMLFLLDSMALPSRAFHSLCPKQLE